MDYKQKYLKYKNKYLKLKQTGGIIKNLTPEENKEISGISEIIKKSEREYNSTIHQRNKARINIRLITPFKSLHGRLFYVYGALFYLDNLLETDRFLKLINNQNDLSEINKEHMLKNKQQLTDNEKNFIENLKKYRNNNLNTQIIFDIYSNFDIIIQKGDDDKKDYELYKKYNGKHQTIKYIIFLLLLFVIFTDIDDKHNEYGDLLQNSYKASGYYFAEYLYVKNNYNTNFIDTIIKYLDIVYNDQNKPIIDYIKKSPVENIKLTLEFIDDHIKIFQLLYDILKLSKEIDVEKFTVEMKNNVINSTKNNKHIQDKTLLEQGITKLQKEIIDLEEVITTKINKMRELQNELKILEQNYYKRALIKIKEIIVNNY